VGADARRTAGLDSFQENWMGTGLDILRRSSFAGPESSMKHPSGAKARVDFAAFSA
jgi:hypothetical protein